MRFSFPQPLRWLLVATGFLLSGETRLCAQAPGWQWATTPGRGEGRATAVDAAGNSYVTGYFRGTTTFGATTLISTGATDLFVAKLSATGTYLWAVAAGGRGDENGAGLAVDGDGYVVVTGLFDSPTATFGSLTLARAGNSDAFVARLTPAGAWQWAVRAGGTGDDRGTAVAVDGTGHVVVSGAFQGTATVGNSTFTTPDYGGFVARLTPAGVWQWANSAEGGYRANINGVAVAPSGSVVVTGDFTGTRMTLGGLTLTNTIVGFDDGFVAQLTPAGDWQWAVPVGGTSNQYGNAVAVTGSGQVIVAGHFYDTVAFGATTLTSAGEEDLFVGQLTPTGVWQWAVRAGASGYDAGQSVVVDGSGHVIVAGRFSGTVAFGATSLTSAGPLTDVFVAKLTPAGTWQWAMGAGGSGQDGGYAVAVESSGQAVVTGGFSVGIRFGSIDLTSPTTFPAIFIARTGTTTGLPETPDQPGLTLSPNPARTTVQLTGATGATASLLDGLGRVVSTVSITPTGGATLDVRVLPAGLYLLRAGGAARRLVVE